MAREQAEALHDEIRRLPVAFRVPVVLCYFEGLTVDEAAGQLRWPARHGPQPPGAGTRQAPPRPHAAAVLLCRRGPCRGTGVRVRLGVVSASLCEITARAAMDFAAGQAAAGRFGRGDGPCRGGA